MEDIDFCRQNTRKIEKKVKRQRNLITSINKLFGVKNKNETEKRTGKSCSIDM